LWRAIAARKGPGQRQMGAKPIQIWGPRGQGSGGGLKPLPRRSLKIAVVPAHPAHPGGEWSAPTPTQEGAAPASSFDQCLSARLLAPKDHPGWRTAHHNLRQGKLAQGRIAVQG